MRHGIEEPMRSRGMQLLSLAFLIYFGGITTTHAANQPGTNLQFQLSPDPVIAQTADGYSASGPLDGDRFSVAPQSLWMGTKKSGSIWQTSFSEPTQIGSILQINSDDPHQLKNAARNYSWQVSDDGDQWTILHETVVLREYRLFRIHRLKQAVTTKHIRLVVNLSYGSAPALREVEFYPAVEAEIAFPGWIVAVSSDEDPDNVSLGMPFISLARLCDGWQNVPAQTIWHGDFDPDFAFAEPRPLCAFLSGSFLEWCQCSREPWRGTQEVLKSRRLPMWGACGGAQVLAILEETGVDQPWDCPRCRNPDQPLLPIYSHIGHTGKTPCGDYSKCIGERGKFQMKIERPDPAFEGLPEIFEIVESHIGQINHVPKGWHRLVTKGPGAHTVNQCLRTDDGPIYAAQFHMEMYQSTVETSKQIMSNFLRVAQESSADETRTVRVRVEVTTPDATEATDDEPGEVFLAGDLKLLGRWRPDGFKLSRADNGVYFAEFSVPPETLVQFKVTRGSWQTVEKDTAGRDIANRQFEVKESKDGEPQRISVRVERWGAATTAKPSVTGTLELHKDVASEHLTQTRNVSVWLPPGYAESDDRYPVLYLHDGQNLFDSSKAAFGVEWQVDETATQLIEKHEIPSVIIVGIWNTPERIDEYTLTRDSRLERGGSGLNYIRFMAEELKPLIDRSYRTRTEREATLIGGSSLGGLISMEACLQRPDVFGVCLAFSPSLGWDQERILDTLRKDGWPENVHLWISMGTQEGRDPETQTRNLTRARRVHELIVPSGSESPVRIRLQEFADGSHDETSWATQFPSALKSVLSAESLRD